MDEKKDRKAEQKRTGRKAGPGGLLQKKNKDMLKDFFKTEDDLKIYIMTDDGVFQKMAKGGRAGLKGGGICKKGMNRKAVGKNS